jgi:hypothetical protein
MPKDMKFVKAEDMETLTKLVTLSPLELETWKTLQVEHNNLPFLDEFHEIAEYLGEVGFFDNIYAEPESIDVVHKSKAARAVEICYDVASFWKAKHRIVNATQAEPNTAILRIIEHKIGKILEACGTYYEAGYLDKAKTLLEAGRWYNVADERVGFFTDYCLRQSEAVGVGADMRKKAGKNDELTEWMAEWSGYLIHNYLGALFGKDGFVLMPFNGKIAPNIGEWYDKSPSESATLYTPIDLPLK